MLSPILKFIYLYVKQLAFNQVKPSLRTPWFHILLAYSEIIILDPQISQTNNNAKYFFLKSFFSIHNSLFETLIKFQCIMYKFETIFLYNYIIYNRLISILSPSKYQLQLDKISTNFYNLNFIIKKILLHNNSEFYPHKQPNYLNPFKGLNFCSKF